ncbi:hypothetical protein CAEBREN_04676 [Caenorhabditis brenneri]|uniref:Uncharacterized protein n=1 Tax=Caenorhabditis brenneri TaxID=135651 RepID=G0MYC3_CAEBE|nr:hypothetical protein CAEBREN_04676 [Caenorhabditis brenneri]
MASQTQLVARKRATPNIGTAPGANNRRAANVDGAAPVQHQAQIHGPPFPNQTFVITNFDEDYYWNIWNSVLGHGFVAKAGRSNTHCQIEAIRYLPTGWLQIVWPLMRRSEVDIREEIIP